MKYPVKKQQKEACSRKNIPAAVVMLLLGISHIFACGEKAPQISQESPKGFTFLDIGKNTTLTVWVERDLGNKLGAGVTERWHTIDLETNYKGFIQKYFPDLYELSQKLKTEVVLKPEENPVKLTYRHTQKKETPFAYVELVFSSHTKKPLLFRIRQKRKRADITDIIRKKHGDPQIADWDENVAYGKKGRSLYWKNNKDMLMVSVSPDRYDQPEYHIIIYYIENMEEELRIKQEKKKKDKDEAIRNAF